MVTVACVWLLMEGRDVSPELSFVSNFNKERLVKMQLCSLGRLGRLFFAS